MAGSTASSSSPASSTSTSSSPPLLANSMTSMPKATYVPLKIPDDEKSKAAVASGGAVRKFGYVSSLNLQPGEVDGVSAALSVALPGKQAQSPLYSLLKRFEGQPLPSQRPSASSFVGIADSDLLNFGNALTTVRQQTAARTAGDVAATNLANAASVATNAFSNGAATSPVGMLNLERMEMTPAGIERGGLLATIPLAPKERTIVVQQEWSVVSQEFTSIVTDSLDNYSETGVTDNTQLTQSTQSQVAHSNQFNINASASGSIGFVTGSVATSFQTQDQSSNSAADSRKHAVQTTRKASSRSTQSHKMTISTSTTTGTSETSTRMLENPSATDPMRIDYFSMMRKWYVALYRYGLRLTYDITVPEPGAVMREAYRQLAELQKQANQTFSFSLSYSQINPNNMTELEKIAGQYGASIPAPPRPPRGSQTASGQAQTGADSSAGVNAVPLTVTFTVNDGLQIDHLTLDYSIGENHPQEGSTWLFNILGYGPQFTETSPGIDQSVYPRAPYYQWNYSNVPLPGFMVGATGSVSVTCIFQWANPAIVVFNIYTTPTDAAIEAWQASVYTALYNAAQTTFYAQQQNINAQIAALQQKLNSVDTLTLRREENDEIMKCALRWLLGRHFEFMPSNVVQYFKKQGGADLQYGIDFTGDDVSLSSSEWTVVTQNEDRINFINQAVDWDNVIYFVYSYFWDVPESWDFIRQIQHPDATRQAFLRAGSARIVLTVRQGWELAWTYFAEFGETSLPANLPQHPYLTIAEQIEAYDSINYPGIPPADPDGGGPVDDDTPQVGTTCDVDLSASTANVNVQVADSTGFVVGATAIIDTWASGVQETQPITAIPDGTHITVQALSYAHSPTQNQNLPYPVVQAGAKGVLIAEWFEYTPTSGVDIAVTSDLATIT